MKLQNPIAALLIFLVAAVLSYYMYTFIYQGVLSQLVDLNGNLFVETEVGMALSIMLGIMIFGVSMMLPASIVMAKE